MRSAHFIDLNNNYAKKEENVACFVKGILVRVDMFLNALWYIWCVVGISIRNHLRLFDSKHPYFHGSRSLSLSLALSCSSPLHCLSSHPTTFFNDPMIVVCLSNLTRRSQHTDHHVQPFAVCCAVDFSVCNMYVIRKYTSVHIHITEQILRLLRS